LVFPAVRPEPFVANRQQTTSSRRERPKARRQAA
jgi:hypothetical protein